MTTPTWICNTCARELCGFYIDGRWVGPAQHVSTYHMGRCDVCGVRDAVTEPRDHGGMVKGWEKRRAKWTTWVVETEQPDGTVLTQHIPAPTFEQARRSTSSPRRPA